MSFSYKNIFIVLVVGFLPLFGIQNLPGNPIGVQMWTIGSQTLGLQKVGIVVLGDPVQNEMWSKGCSSCSYLDVIDLIVSKQNALSDENQKKNFEEIGNVSVLFVDTQQGESKSARMTEHYLALYKCKTYSPLFVKGAYIDSDRKFEINFNEALSHSRKILIVLDANVDLLDQVIGILGMSLFNYQSCSWSEFDNFAKRTFFMYMHMYLKSIAGNSSEFDSFFENSIMQMDIESKEVIGNCIKSANPLKKEYIHAFINDLLTCCNYCGKRTKKRCADCHLARYCSDKCRIADFANHHQFCLEADLQV